MHPLNRALAAWLLCGLCVLLWDRPAVGAIGAEAKVATRSSNSLVLDDLSVAERVTLWTMSAVTGLFFLVVGTCVGSFINVVVHRWPRGLSLTHPPSRCPTCETPIESRDNLPIIGWLLLRGRCRACQGRISIRYPLVELLVGALFVGLLAVELLSGGANLPMRQANIYKGVVWVLWYTKWDLVAIYVFHLSLLVGLLLVTESFRDGFAPVWTPVRRSLPTWFAVGGLAALAIFPELHLVPIAAWPERWGDSLGIVSSLPQHWRTGWIWMPGPNGRGPLTGVVGGVVGVLTGLALQAEAGWLGRSAADARTWRTTLPLIGVFLGWQSVVAVAVATAVMLVLLRLGPTRTRTGVVLSTDVALIAACGGIGLWKNLYSLAATLASSISL